MPSSPNRKAVEIPLALHEDLSRHVSNVAETVSLAAWEYARREGWTELPSPTGGRWHDERVDAALKRLALLQSLSTAARQYEDRMRGWSEATLRARRAATDALGRHLDALSSVMKEQLAMERDYLVCSIARYETTVSASSAGADTRVTTGGE